MELEEKLKQVPEQPGVYLYHDEAGRVIYVGKARNLKARVRQYFQSSRNLGPKTQVLVSHIRDLEWVVTDTEVEALVLESNLIKKHKPRYNIRLRDDKHYPYLRLNLNEAWPRLEIARRVAKDGARYFGPFTSSTALNETLKLVRRLFPLRACKNPERWYPRGCLQYHIGRCLGPCAKGEAVREAYDAQVKDVILFLEGRQEQVLKQLRVRMAQAAEEMAFERAAELRDQIWAVEQIIERQKIISTSLVDHDVIAFAREGGDACLQLFFVRRGKLLGRDQFFLRETEELSPGELIGLFLQQHYAEIDFVPKEILVAATPPELEVIEAWLSEKRGAKVSVRQPLRGEKRQLVELVAKNAEEGLALRRSQAEREQELTEGAVDQLQELLGLPTRPHRIECFDISHVQGSEVVAAMVVAEGGRLKKDDYRRFKMKVDRNDDYANMYEAVYRRFKRGLEGGTKFAALPDFLLIDGGKGQLNAARAALAELGLSAISTYALAEEEELLFTEGVAEPIRLPLNGPALQLLRRVRDETHRFVISYHRSLHRKTATRSRLDEVPGVGPARRKALLKHFGSVRRLAEASVDEIAAVPGLNRRVAEEVLRHLK